ncbi:MAG: DUF1801 domain-containing protein [Burkholderiaceae bacterium]
MAENKTAPTDASVDAIIASRASAQQRDDLVVLQAMLSRVTGQPPVIWGRSMIGYGAYRYRYESGRTGTAPVVGLTILRREFALHLAPYWEGAEPFLRALGPHRMGKGCLYVRRLSEIDLAVLEDLITGSIAELARRYGGE